MQPNDALVVLITAGSEEKGAQLARSLVEERLAACVNLLPKARSIYRWEGKVQDEAEVLLVVKTRRDAFERLRARVLELHDYSCPEVIALPLAAGHEPYLKWLSDSVG